MADQLAQLLRERATPTVPDKLPPAWKRYLTALKMEHGYKNSWSPNPTLIRILEGQK